MRLCEEARTLGGQKLKSRLTSYSRWLDWTCQANPDPPYSHLGMILGFPSCCIARNMLVPCLFWGLNLRLLEIQVVSLPFSCDFRVSLEAHSPHLQEAIFHHHSQTHALDMRVLTRVRLIQPTSSGLLLHLALLHLAPAVLLAKLLLLQTLPGNA